MKPSSCGKRLGLCMLQPLPERQWNFTTAGHLMNRAGFGGTPAEIEELLALGLEKAVARFIDYDQLPDGSPAPEWAAPDPERVARCRAARGDSAGEAHAAPR